MTGLFGRLLLAAVFGAAAIAKLSDRQGWRRTLTDFGVPEGTARWAVALLPLSELTVAVLLVPATTARLAAAGALGLLALFTTAVVVNLARGRRPDCHCFGQLHSTPVGPGVVARNGVLAAISAVVFWQPGTALRSAEQVETVAIVGLALAVGVLAWAVYQLLRQQGRLLLRLDAVEAQLGDRSQYEGLPVGTPAPFFALPSLSGENVTLDALLAAGRPLVLVFVHSNCGPCGELLPVLGRWQHSDALTVAVVAAGEDDVNRAKAEEHALSGVLLEDGQKVADAYGTTATPSAVLIGPDGKIGSPVVAGGAAIEKLLLRAPVHDIELTDGVGEGRQVIGHTL
jgi:peroxiredoxin